MGTITNNWIIDVIILLTLILMLIYKHVTRNFNYWKNRGVPYIVPIPLFGSITEVMLLRKPLGIFLSESYNKIKGDYFGLFFFDQPYLFIKSPNLIKTILIKDFNYFQNRSTITNETGDPILSRALFFLKNPEWKIMRNSLSPIFSTAKLKCMGVLVNDVAEQMKTYLNEAKDLSSIEAKELCAKYSTNVIASCAFGLDAFCFQQEDAKFRVLGRKMFDYSFFNAARQMSYWFAQTFVRIFKYPFFEKSVNDFMESVFSQAIKERENNNYTRNDLIDVIIQLKMKQNLNDEIKFGERLGLFVSKLGIVHILTEFEVEKNEKTPVPVVFETQSLVLASRGGLPISFKRKTSLAA